MYKAKNNLLPGDIQQLFLNREGRYNIRAKCNFKQLCVRTTLKSFCVSICGVKLWNRLSSELNVQV